MGNGSRNVWHLPGVLYCTILIILPTLYTVHTIYYPYYPYRTMHVHDPHPRHTWSTIARFIARNRPLNRNITVHFPRQRPSFREDDHRARPI